MAGGSYSTTRTSEFKTENKNKKYICLNHRNIIRYALSVKNFVDNCFIDINNMKNLPNVFLRTISEIIIVTNLKLRKFLKHAGCPRGEGSDQIWTMTDKGGRGVKKFNILPDVLCEWPLKSLCLGEPKMAAASIECCK